ncbi:MAG TPA: hypothetical protein PKO15_03210 [Fibrobacteria bacterium]|nr:hypothetical protein [Fibrobacteria bacterium]
MAGDFDRADQVMRVAIGFQQQSDMQGFRKFFAFWVVEGRLQVQAQWEVKNRLKELDMPEIMDWFREEGIALGKAAGMAAGKAEGIEEGLRQKAMEDARRMLDRGCDWAFVTDITGIKPEDLAPIS